MNQNHLRVPTWIALAAGFFGLFALAIGIASLTNPSMFDIDTENDLQYVGLITGSARNLALGGILVLTAWRRRPEELRLTLGLRAAVDAMDMALSFGSPDVNPISIVVAGSFAVVAAGAAWRAHRLLAAAETAPRQSPAIS